jgi:hypothetical protein
VTKFKPQWEAYTSNLPSNTIAISRACGGKLAGPPPNVSAAALRSPHAIVCHQTN